VHESLWKFDYTRQHSLSMRCNVLLLVVNDFFTFFFFKAELSSNKASSNSR